MYTYSCFTVVCTVETNNIVKQRFSRKRKKKLADFTHKIGLKQIFQFFFKEK